MAVGTEGAKNVMGRLDQVAAQHHVARFGDPQLWLAVSGAVLTRAQASIGADGGAVDEPGGILQPQHERVRRDGPYASDLLQAGHLRIARVARLW